MKGTYDFEAVNAAALASCPGLLERLLPGGKLRGQEYVCGDVNGGSGESFSINTQTGKWADFATDQRGAI